MKKKLIGMVAIAGLTFFAGNAMAAFNVGVGVTSEAIEQGGSCQKAGGYTMAFDNRGAQWLQNSQELRNPYFGQTMLKCGSIEEVIAGANTENAGDIDD